jgi:hypothetical protein
MKYKILRTDGDFDFHNNSTITELPEGAIALTDAEWENRLLRIETNEEILQKAKDAKIAQITPARDAFMYADIEYNGSFFINSQVSGNNLTAEIATQTPVIEWLDSSGNQVDLTLEQAKELSTLIKAKRRTAYFKEATLLAQINACQTLEELENININF